MPLLAGTCVHIVDVPDGGVVLAPPPPGDGLADVAAAVREALRFPLAGDALSELATRGGRATIVVEPPGLPIPGAAADPRKAALAAVSDELEQAGIPPGRQTLLVAGGLARRSGPREVEGLATPELARRFTGQVVVHDAADPGLMELGAAGRVQLRVNRALVETDLVVVVSAAQTVLHGGPATLLAASSAQSLRAANAYSLLETAASNGWRLAVELERALLRRVPAIGVSLALDQPRFGGALRGYPYDPEAVERIAGSPLRRLFGLLPGPLRARVILSLRSELHASAAFAGPPSVAHAETLLRSVEARSAVLDGPLDAVCIGIPRTTPYVPRERPNPLLAAHLGLALALRLWRDTFPVADGGAVVLVHRFHRVFAHPTQQPYRAFFAATRFGREPEELADAERKAGADARALDLYRDGRTCHPLLPFVDWAACAPALSRVSTVLVAGCRDAAAARQLGFVPAHSAPAALELVRGTLGRPPRVGFLLAPPFFPIRTGPGSPT